MEKLSSNRAQLSLRIKYTVFTMDGTVATFDHNNITYNMGDLTFKTGCHYSLIN